MSLRAKLHLDIVRAQLDADKRALMFDMNRKATEASIASSVEMDPAFITARELQIEADVRKNELYGILDAVRSKKEMLISLGAHLRSEMGADPTLREQARARYNGAGE